MANGQATFTSTNTKYHEASHNHCSRVLSWTAVFVGALVAVGLSFLFNLFNLGVGLTSLSANVTNTGATAMATGVYIWLIICAIITMFVGGWVAGSLSRFNLNRCVGALHGFVAWCLALVLTVMLASHIAALLASNPRVVNVGRANVRVLDVNRVGTADNTRAANTTVMTQDDKNAAATAGGATLATFFIFLIGALAATVGGIFGVNRCRVGDHQHDNTYPQNKL